MRSASICPHCEGVGKRIGKRPSNSGPDGMVKKEETIKIKIPAGVEEGNYMTMSGQGNQNVSGTSGDLIIVFEEKDHQFFVRDGENVILELLISFPVAVLGGKIEIPTLDGKVGLKIPKGIQSGQILRLKGKGFPKIRSRFYGDQLVKIQIDTPKKLSRSSKNLIDDLKSNLHPIDNPFRKIEL